MTGRLRGRLETLGDVFWIRPAVVILLGVALGEVLVMAEQTGVTLPLIPESWIYAGGESGARALLGAVATSTIGVAGTTFSITVAALSLASGQMGPRLLRNFVRDPGNQYTLGVFLATFAYSLVVLRTVRSVDETAFVPHLGVTGALLLALLCIGTLVWFVHHIAAGINVETVIDLVHDELSGTIGHLTLGEADATPPGATTPHGAAPGPGVQIRLHARGYLRSVNDDALAEWAASQGAVLVLLVRPGEYLAAGSPVAELPAGGDPQEATEVVRGALSLGRHQAAAQDLEFAVRQLVEVAVRALSPGINDPFTAIAVLDRLGATLCEIVPRFLPSGLVVRDGNVVLFKRVTDYAGLCDTMFHMIRQNAAGSTAVLIHLLETLRAVLAVEPRRPRRDELFRHVELVVSSARSGIDNPDDLAEIEGRHASLLRMRDRAGG